MEIAWLDLTTGQRSSLPALPTDAAITLERPQSYQTFGILGSIPHVQVTAVGVETCTLNLDLWGVAGQAFYRDFVKPAYGTQQNGFKPHTIQLAWGPSSEDVFTGMPIGKPPTRLELEDDGKIFAHVFDLILTQVANQLPRAYRVASGEVLNTTFSYTVKDGETLQDIAVRYGISLEEMASANGGNPPFVPSAGFVLNVPRKGQ